MNDSNNMSKLIIKIAKIMCLHLGLSVLPYGRKNDQTLIIKNLRLFSNYIKLSRNLNMVRKCDKAYLCHDISDI